MKLRGYSALQQFLDNVPRDYCRNIQQLDVCTQIDDDMRGTMPDALQAQTEAVISLLIACPRLTQLALRMAGSLEKSVIAAFTCLPGLKSLTITNCYNEEQSPLYVLTDRILFLNRRIDASTTGVSALSSQLQQRFLPSSTYPWTASRVPKCTPLSLWVFIPMSPLSLETTMFRIIPSSDRSYPFPPSYACPPSANSQSATPT